MRKAYLGIFLAVSSVACVSQSDDRVAEANQTVSTSADSIFDTTAVHTVGLTIPPDSWAALEADPRTYAKADFVLDGESVASVGVKLKGLRSFRDLNGKASFKIKFNKFVSGQKFRSLKHMTLNGAVQDPTFAHEALFYQLARANHVPSPRTGYASLTVNDKPYGLYVNIETEDDVLLRRWSFDDGGHLYEGTLRDVAGSPDTFDLEQSPEPPDRSGLASFITALDQVRSLGYRAALDAHLDIEEFFRFAAVEGIAGAEDGCAYGHGELPANNYRFYAPPGGKFSFLPWGTDVSFDRQMGMFGIHGKVLYTCTEYDPACRAEYLSRVREVLAVFEHEKLLERANAIHDLIRDRVAGDPRREFDMAAFDSAWVRLRAFIAERPAAVREDLRIDQESSSEP